MRKLFIIQFLLLLFVNGKSQTDSLLNVKDNEISLTTNSLKSFGFQYKKQLNNSLFLRLGTVETFFDYTYQEPTNPSMYSNKDLKAGLTFIVGLEKRKRITDKFIFNYGLNFILLSVYSRYTTDNPVLTVDKRTIEDYNFEPGLKFNLGTIFKLNDNFYFGAELLPFVYYIWDSPPVGASGYKSKHLNFHLSTSELSLSLIYRWNKNTSR